MYITKTKVGDIPRLMQIFARARRFMADTGNPGQWSGDYPDEDVLMCDIRQGDSYVCIDGDTIVATFVLRGGNDPTYGVIYEGRWPSGRPYATIHRIASNGERKGIFKAVMEFALQHYSTIRIDTHRDNRVMRHVITGAGFTYCGIIHCWNGDERLAFQLN